MKVTFINHDKIAENIFSFRFKPYGPVDYLAGQYTELRLVHKNVDSRGDRRWFTLSSSPSEALLSITTKFSEPGSSFKQALLELKPGTKLHLADPMGDFVLPKDPRIPLVFVAGGMGITPMRSMMKWLSDNQEQRTIELIYALNSKRELVFYDLLAKQIEQLTFLTRETDGAVASLSAKSILAMVKQPELKRFYLSGPESMIEALVEQFEQSSINKDQIVTDYFPGYDPV